MELIYLIICNEENAEMIGEDADGFIREIVGHQGSGVLVLDESIPRGVIHVIQGVDYIGHVDIHDDMAQASGAKPKTKKSGKKDLH